jgi:hypothetical protein
MRKLTFMRFVRIFSLACTGAVMASAQPAEAQETVFHIHKKGDTVSVANAVVTIDHVIEAGKTDAHGIVRVPDLEDGGHIIEVSAPGYQYIFDQFDSGPKVKLPIEVDLAVDTRQQNAVKGPATGLRFADFDRRRTKGVGTFLTRAQLDAATGRPLSNVLKMDAKAVIVSGPNAESFVASDGGAGSSGPCYATVVRDGIRVYPVADVSPPDLDKIFAEQLAGLELYSRAAIVPAELHDAAKCGALVIWSREAGK